MIDCLIGNWSMITTTIGYLPSVKFMVKQIKYLCD